MDKEPKYLLNFTIPQGPTGLAETVSLGKVVTASSSEEAQIIDNKEGLNHKLDFVIPKGVDGKDGPTGPAGPLVIPTALFMTFDSEDQSSGIKVDANERIPIELKISSEENDFVLNSEENTITIKNPGIYRIDFTVYACSIYETSFFKDRDIIAIGFKKPNENTVYAGASVWNDNKLPMAIVGNGIIFTTLPQEEFELLNVGKKEIYLNTPDLDEETSSFAKPVVSIIIQKIK